MATIKNFDLPLETVKYLDELGMTSAPARYGGTPGYREFLMILDNTGAFVIAVHYTTTKYMLQHIFSYGRSQLDLGKKMAQRTIIEALGLHVEEQSRVVEFPID